MGEVRRGGEGSCLLLYQRITCIEIELQSVPFAVKGPAATLGVAGRVNVQLDVYKRQGEDHPLADSLKQGNSQPGFQVFQVAAESGLGNIELVRGL